MLQCYNYLYISIIISSIDVFAFYWCAEIVPLILNPYRTIREINCYTLMFIRDQISFLIFSFNENDKGRMDGKQLRYAKIIVQKRWSRLLIF